MIPQTQPRAVKNSGKVNLLISFIFHAILVLTLFYFAAREGLLGKNLEKISVELVKKEKLPDKPKPPEPKVEPPKVDVPKVTDTPKVAEAPKASAPPTTAPPVMAPANNELPAFEFDGSKAVETSSDPIQLYKGFLEYALRSKWDRPDNLDDDSYVAEVELAVARDGRLANPRWQKTSGNTLWDKSVQAALTAVAKVDRPPPTNFPPRVVIRFDVQLETEAVLQ
jgi:hypothetical protein